MRRMMFLLFVIFCLYSNAQQSFVYGVISIQNSKTETGKRQYINNAQVEDNLDWAQPALTDGNGEFHLTYIKPEKTSVSFRVTKSLSDLEVVNVDALKAITGQTEVVKISMAAKDKIADYRKKIYLVGKTTAEKELDKLVKVRNEELAALRINGSKNTEKIQRLEQGLEILEQQRAKIDATAKELADKYTPINLDDASPLFRNAFALFQNGRLDSALLILTKVDLASMVYQILKEREKIARIEKETIKRDSIQKQRSEDIGEALEFKADLHKTSFEYDSAAVSYELLIKLDSSNTKYLFDYAYFLAWLNQYDKAINFYLKILSIYQDKTKNNLQMYEPGMARLQNNLGMLYADKNDYFKAEQAYLEALKMRKRSASILPQTYEPDIAMIENNLGLLYWSKKEFEKSEQAYLGALEINERLARVDPQTYEPDVAMTQSNLGILYDEENNYNKAEQALLKALEFYQKLSKANPQTYDPSIAKTQNNLGVLYWNINDFSKAEKAYQESLTIRKRLAKVNPQTYEPAVASTQNNLGNLYIMKKDFIRAEQACLEALEVYKKLATTNPQTYEPLVAMTKTNLGSLYDEMDNFTKAEQTYLEALEVNKRLANENPHTYEPDVAMTQNNIGLLYANNNDYIKAEKALHEALEIYKRIADSNPQTYQPYLASVQNNMGTLYHYTKNYKESEKLLIESLNIRETWMKLYPDVYTPKAIETAGNLLDLYSTIFDTLQNNPVKLAAQFNFTAVENSLNVLAKENEELKNKLSTYYGSFSWYLLLGAQFPAAERSAIKALQTDSSQTWVIAIKAHALLFQGKYQEAYKLYQKLKPLKTTQGQPYANICLDDLKELEKRGITHPDVDKIRAFLKQ